MKNKQLELKRFLSIHDDLIAYISTTIIILSAVFLLLFTFSQSNNDEITDRYCLTYDREEEMCIYYQQTIFTMDLPFNIYEGENGKQLKEEIQSIIIQHGHPNINIDSYINTNTIEAEYIDVGFRDIRLNKNFYLKYDVMKCINKYYPELAITETEKLVDRVDIFQYNTKKYLGMLMFNGIHNLFIWLIIIFSYFASGLSAFFMLGIYRLDSKNRVWKKSTRENFKLILKNIIILILIFIFSLILFTLPLYAYLYNPIYIIAVLLVWCFFVILLYANYKAKIY